MKLLLAQTLSYVDLTTCSLVHADTGRSRLDGALGRRECLSATARNRGVLGRSRRVPFWREKREGWRIRANSPAGEVADREREREEEREGNRRLYPEFAAFMDVVHKHAPGTKLRYFRHVLDGLDLGT